MKAARKFHSAGQALPLALVLLAAVAATVFFMFNSGQLVQEKIRLTNTADAVAYSAGVFEARVLNYDAYTNRAIIANEIAIGQAVGLASWAKYAGTAASNISPWVSLIPYVGEALSAALDAVAEFMDLITYAFAGAVTLHDGTINALKVSQKLMDTTALIDRNWLMNQVAKKNDPDAAVDFLPLSDDFNGFTQRYESKDERKRMGQLVNDGRDAFLQSRSWNFGLVALCEGAEIRKRGSTELVDLADGWKSMDTVSGHKYWLHFGFFGISCKHSELPVGYGSAYSVDGMDDSSYDYAGSRSTNPIASILAYSTVASGFSPVSISGGAIPPFYDLSTTAVKDNNEDPRTSMAIRVTKSGANQRFSGGSSVVKPSGRLDLYAGNQARSKSAAVARAEVYFERPDGNNKLFGREEYGNLFNPYWQARLAPITAAQRAAAQALQGLTLP